LGIAFSALFAIYTVNKIYHPPEPVTLRFYFICLIFSGFIAILFGFGLRLNNNLKVNLAILVLTTSIAVYGFEIYLEFSGKIILPDDMRTKMEVLEDLKASGIKAFPSVSPNLFIATDGLSVDNEIIYPFGGISGVPTIGVNESGYYPIMKIDEYGFNNPKGLYKKNRVDIILTGDSYTEGPTVHSYETIGAVLRQIGYNAISIGKSGNGPLLELAALKEYAEPFEPTIVMWLYYEHNDMENLRVEMSSSVLRKYLHNNKFSQNLISKQIIIDSLLINYTQETRKKKPITKGISFLWANSIMKLSNLRARINLMPTQASLSEQKFETFKNILGKSKIMVSEWNGTMYFVYLPAFGKYSIGKEHIYRETVLRTVKDLDISVIDINRSVFQSHPDPLSLFPYRKIGHYNSEGYRLVAETIGNRLNADGFIPSNANN
jgi:hypothetical protein